MLYAAGSTHPARGATLLACTAGDIPHALAPFLAHNLTLPPVSFVPGMQPPTALSWLRRRGPSVGHARLFQLFRQRQVSACLGAWLSHPTMGVFNATMITSMPPLLIVMSTKWIEP